MHVLNEIGYPQHDQPEALPAIRLCVDLVNDPLAGGFFYTNDIKVVIDVILRELRNIPLVADSEAELRSLEENRVMYLRLTGALVSRSAWAAAGESYHKEELREALFVLAEGEDVPAWSKDVASEILADTGDLL